MFRRAHIAIIAILLLIAGATTTFADETFLVDVDMGSRHSFPLSPPHLPTCANGSMGSCRFC